MYNLLIIDMQKGFGTSFPVIEEVVKLVHRAKNDNANIVVVEYRGNGDTHDQITEAIGTYQFFTVLKKARDDGGKELFNYLNSEGHLNKPNYFCGVNSDCCVKLSANTLDYLIRDYFSKIELDAPNTYVIKKACNHNDHPWNTVAEWWWDNYNSGILLLEGETENVKLVKA